MDDAYELRKKQGDIDWPRNYAALLEYYKEYGTCNIPQKQSYECDLEGLGINGGVHHYAGNLGRWLMTQRCARKNRNTTEPPSERELQMQLLVDEGKLSWELEGITVVKKKQGDIDWPRHYAALLEYYKQFGTCDVPAKRNYECDLEGLGENGAVHHYVGKLGQWLTSQKQAAKGQCGYKIASDRLALLQKLVDEGKMHWNLRRITGDL